MFTETELMINKNICRLRREAHLTQDQVAARLQVAGMTNLTRSGLAKIEAGQRHMRPDEILLLSHILGVTVNDIFDIGTH